MCTRTCKIADCDYNDLSSDTAIPWERCWRLDQNEKDGNHNCWEPRQSFVEAEPTTVEMNSGCKYDKRKNRDKKPGWLSENIGSICFTGVIILLLLMMVGCIIHKIRSDSTFERSVSTPNAIVNIQKRDSVSIDTKIQLFPEDMDDLRRIIGVAKISEANAYRIYVYKAEAFTLEDVVCRVTAHIEQIAQARKEK